MAVILYLDLLGARSRWKREGAVGAETAFNDFARLVVAGAKPDLAQVLDGGIETDSAALVCEDTPTGLRIADRCIRYAFFRDVGNDRTWLRGSLVPWDGKALRTSRPAHGKAKHLSIWTYSPSFLDAVAVEKSGFKGMRLLVRPSLVNETLKREFRIVVNPISIPLFRRLRHSSYPTVQDGNLQDYLWMIKADDNERLSLSFQMALRLREANADPEEFAQAAATQVVFHEAESIYRSVTHRAAVLRHEGKRTI